MWKEPELSPRLGSPDEEFLETTAEVMTICSLVV
ncbi:mCG1028441, isoform CRA_a [Mus musculus]|nr:mCG1028441, isoform CRA_a [Mus musculus]